MKNVFLMIITGILIIALCVGLWIAGGFIGLWWYPYQMREQQQLVTASPGFVQSKEQEISTFMLAYSSTNSNRQKKGIIQTICLDASQVDVGLPAPEADFVTRHCS
jgi:hypothetical protein